MKKNRIWICMTAVLLLLCPIQARADSGDSFRLDSSGLVTLDSFHAAKEKVSSISFSLTVEPEDAAKVEFVFEGIGAEILEYRYHADEKKMNIYMAGTTPLFAKGTESLAVGRVVVSDGNGQQGKAILGVEPDSLKFVYGSTLRGMEGVGIPENVAIGRVETPPPVEPPIETPPPVETPPANTPTPTPPPTPTPTPTPAEPPTAPPQNPPAQNTTPSAPAASNAPVTVTPVPVGRPNPGSSQGTATATSTPSPTPRPQGAKEPEAETTTEPPQTESPSPEPDDTQDESFVLPGANIDAGEGEGTEKGGGFLEELRLILAGLAIAATVAGVCAVAVAAFIKHPKGR